MTPDVSDLIWFRVLFGFLFGMILGSFVTMLSYRLPRGESIITPPSRCPMCGTRLGLCDLIPLFSWILNLGRCAHCNAPISARYPLIEGVMALFCTFASLWIGVSVALIPVFGLLLALLTFFTVHFEHR